jgi:hypothetical protein
VVNSRILNYLINMQLQQFLMAIIQLVLMLMIFTYRRHIMIFIRLHLVLSIQGILREIKTTGLIIFESSKDIQRKSIYNMEIVTIFAKISAQLVEKKAIQNVALIVQDLAHRYILFQNLIRQR